MLSKKITVQKSFRIEGNMERDLELLSTKLNRPQNELVNEALNQLMIENMDWFVEDYLVDLCEDFFEKKVSEIEINISTLKLRLVDTGSSISQYYEINTNSLKETSNGFCVNDESGYKILENELKDIALKIGSDAPEIQTYLHNRFDYIYSRETNIHKFNKEEYIHKSIDEE